MDKYINVNNAVVNFGFEWDDIAPTHEEFVAFLKRQPVADVAPVVHGKWLLYDDDWYSLTTIRCSICGEEWCFETDDDVDLLNYKHCPNCGAKMDGGEE